MEVGGSVVENITNIIKYNTYIVYQAQNKYFSIHFYLLITILWDMWDLLLLFVHKEAEGPKRLSVYPGLTAVVRQGKDLRTQTFWLPSPGCFFTTPQLPSQMITCGRDYQDELWWSRLPNDLSTWKTISNVRKSVWGLPRSKKGGEGVWGLCCNNHFFAVVHHALFARGLKRGCFSFQALQ